MLKFVRSKGVVVAVLLSAVSVITAGAQPSHPSEQYVEGEVLVSFKPSVSIGNARQAASVHGMAFTRHFGQLSRSSGRHSGLLRDKTRTTAQLVAELSKDPSVATVEPNYIRWTSNQDPSDPLFPQMWGLNNTGQSVNGVTGSAGHDIKFTSAWSLARPTSGPIVVAVIDTGIDLNHPDLVGNIWTNNAEIGGNAFDDDGNGYVDDVNGYDFADGIADPSDSGFHGTHVAGTIAAANNTRGVIGVNYRAQVMPLKTSNDGSSLSGAAIIEAIDYATMMKGRGVNIVAINASFGGGGSNSLERASIQAAGDAGIIFCAAAGNNSLNHDVTADYPSSYRLSNMIVVAATDQNDALASFSDYGATTVDLGAPGVNILSTKPTWLPGTTSLVLQGSNTYSAIPLTYSGMTTGITAAAIDCGLGNPADFPASVSNQIALISRGTIQFSAKATNAKNAGARAAIIYNNVSGNFSGTLQSAGSWLPALGISEADGLALKAALPATATVLNKPDPEQIYQLLNGTSMATPHVAGAVAFAAMNFPTETVPQRIQRLLQAVDPVPALLGKVRTGGRLNLLRTVDADSNLLPDWWEQNYFGHLTGTDPAGDPDHDGATNLAEWLSGTDPTNSASVLRLSIRSTTNNLLLEWPSSDGKSYRLESSTNLLAGFNTVVRSNIPATPPVNSEPILPAAAKAAFYRLGVE